MLYTLNPTHRGVWLEVFITQDDCQLADLVVLPLTVLDHGLVVATVPFLREMPIHLESWLRDWRTLDHIAFCEALLGVPAFADLTTIANIPISYLFAIYGLAVTNVVNTLLPVCPVRMRCSVLTQWFNAECLVYRQHAHRLERHYRGTRLADDRMAWVSMLNRCTDNTSTRSQVPRSVRLPFMLGSRGGSGRPLTTSWAIPAWRPARLRRPSQLMPSWGPSRLRFARPWMTASRRSSHL